MSANMVAGFSKRLVLHAASTVNTVVTNQASPTGTVGALFPYGTVTAVLKVTAGATAAGDTLDVYVDTSLDGGTTWINIIHFTQVLGNAAVKTFAATVARGGGQVATTTDVSADAASGVVRPNILGDMLRARYTTVQASAVSFTFGVTAEAGP